SLFISTAGNVGIGTTTPGTYKLNIDGTGYLNTSAWVYASDIRLKENINYLGGGLDKILQLKPAKFDYIVGEKNQLGFIAQDVQGVIPEAVIFNEGSGMFGLKSDFIVPYLVNAVKELNAKIASSTMATSTLQASQGTIDLTTLNADLNLNGFAILNVKSIAGMNGLWKIDENGNITAQSVQTQALTVGGGVASGVTVYDRQTSAPTCIYIEGGAIKTSDGACGQTQNTGTVAEIIPASDSVPPATSTTTPDIIPMATTTPPVVEEPLVATSTPEIIIATSTPDLPAQAGTSTTTP
ncbi:MAG: tail fiber domain-containing protein, partial [Patescibacteria group bacterium]